MKRVECSSKSGDEKRLEKGYHEYANASGRTKLHKVGSFFVCFQCNVFPSVPFVFIIRFFFSQRLFGSRATPNGFFTSSFNSLSEFASKPGGALLLPNPTSLRNDDRR
jgi:hypothetical protein